MNAILVIFILSIAMHIVGGSDALMLWPIPSEQFRPWQLVTYALLHGSALHLALNMLALWSFGPPLVREWGTARFLGCYAAAAALGGCMQASMSSAPTVGASAALFGLFGAYVMLYPRRRVLSLLPRPIEAWKLLALYATLSVLAIAFDWLATVAHLAHLGGAAAGVLFALANNDKPRR